MSLIAELKRRNVLRAAAAYIVVSWLLIQVTETIFPLFGYSDAPARFLVIFMGICFTPVMIFAWVFEWTPQGFRIATIFAFRDESDKAFEWLDKAVQYKDGGLAEVHNEPLFSNIHDDPRWISFLESQGKSPEQLSAIEFNAVLPD